MSTEEDDFEEIWSAVDEDGDKTLLGWDKEESAWYITNTESEIPATVYLELEDLVSLSDKLNEKLKGYRETAPVTKETNAV